MAAKLNNQNTDARGAYLALRASFTLVAALYNAAGLYTADDYAAAATEPEPTANSNYRLADADARWMKSGEAATSFAAIAATARMENAEYAAQYVRQRTVTFLAGEHGTITAGGSVTVDDGAVLTEENIPTPAPETGYEFTGWKVTGGDAIDPVGQTITADTSYTAQYALKKYAVSFHDSDGSLIGTVQTVEHGSYASTVDPSKSDSEFRGWYIVTDANESYTDQTLYTSEQINAAAVTADISYKALYSLNVYRVTADAANAEVSFVSGVTDDKVTAGEAIVFTLTAKSGYTTADAEVSYQIGTETAVALTAGEDGSYTIPASQVNGNVKIIAVLKLDLKAEIVSMENVADYRVLKVETGKLPEGKVYQYDSATTLYYSEAHNAYVCLVPADDTQASAKLSLADGTVLAIARGDINGDTAVDTLDAMLTYTYYNNVDGKFDTLISEKNAALLFALDYNGDFVVNILDVTAIIIAYLGL